MYFKTNIQAREYEKEIIQDEKYLLREPILQANIEETYNNNVRGKHIVVPYIYLRDFTILSM